MILVGLTGGIASGKSIVSGFLQKEGAVIVDADEICHTLILKGHKAYSKVISAFGTQILNSEGEINRKKLGNIVFKDAQAREHLNQILHPLVFAQLDTEKQRIAREAPHRVLIFDAPLLIETQAYKKMDRVLLVYVDRKTQHRRLIRHRGLTPAEATLRIAAQMPLDEKRRFADEIIDNNKSLDALKDEVHAIYQRLLKKAADIEPETPA